MARPVRRGDLVVWKETRTSLLIGADRQIRTTFHVGICVSVRKGRPAITVPATREQFELRRGFWLSDPFESFPLPPKLLDAAFEMAAYADQLDPVGWRLPDVAAARESMDGMRALIEARLPGVLGGVPSNS